MNNSSRFFANKECEYYPCHEGIEDMNCMFCYCPLNGMEPCPGTPEYIEIKGKRVKDCSNCLFPHMPENYDTIIRLLSK